MLSAMSEQALIKTEIQKVSALLKKHLLSLAEERAAQLLEAHPNNQGAQLLMAEVLTENRDHLAAAKILEGVLEDAPGNPQCLQATSMAWLRSGTRDKALKYCKQLLKATNNSPKAIFALADIYERNSMVPELEETIDRIPTTGEFDDAIDAFNARLHMQRKEYDEAIKCTKAAIEVVNQKSTTDKGGGLHRLQELLFMLVKGYDRQGNYDEAWATAEKAHSLNKKKMDTELMLSQQEKVLRFLTKETLSSLAHGTELEFMPLFIIGNPRSGTSLLEQILSMHPDVANGGEMSISALMQAKMPKVTDSLLPWPQCMVDMRVEDANKLASMYEDAAAWFSAGKRVVSNKALNLVWQIGMLSLVMPKSRAIMLYRHPLDNCVSCYTTNLLHSGHIYTNDLHTLSQVWISRRECQEAWLEALEIPVMELHYEDIVMDQENETRRLIDFLDLPWDDRCLDVHKSTRVAATISYDQVNKKMYKTSSGRWKNYEKHLGPLIDTLGDYL
jgi:tetratricopeptide (TPR) repeat protein